MNRKLEHKFNRSNDEDFNVNMFSMAIDSQRAMHTGWEQLFNSTTWLVAVCLNLHTENLNRSMADLCGRPASASAHLCWPVSVLSRNKDAFPECSFYLYNRIFLPWSCELAPSQRFPDHPVLYTRSALRVTEQCRMVLLAFFLENRCYIPCIFLHSENLE